MANTLSPPTHTMFDRNFPRGNVSAAITWLQDPSKRDFSECETYTSMEAGPWKELLKLLEDVTGIKNFKMKRAMDKSLEDLFGEQWRAAPKLHAKADHHQQIANGALTDIKDTMGDICGWKDHCDEWLVAALSAMSVRWVSSWKKMLRDQKTKSRSGGNAATPDPGNGPDTPVKTPGSSRSGADRGTRQAEKGKAKDDPATQVAVVKSPNARHSLPPQPRSTLKRKSDSGDGRSSQVIQPRYTVRHMVHFLIEVLWGDEDDDYSIIPTLAICAERVTGIPDADIRGRHLNFNKLKEILEDEGFEFSAEEHIMMGGDDEVRNSDELGDYIQLCAIEKRNETTHSTILLVVRRKGEDGRDGDVMEMD